MFLECEGSSGVGSSDRGGGLICAFIVTQTKQLLRRQYTQAALGLAGVYSRAPKLTLYLISSENRKDI